MKSAHELMKFDQFVLEIAIGQLRRLAERQNTAGITNPQHRPERVITDTLVRFSTKRLARGSGPSEPVGHSRIPSGLSCNMREEATSPQHHGGEIMQRTD